MLTIIELVKKEMTNREETAEIRRIIKGVCPTVSVTMGKGTDRDTVQINGSLDEFGRFTVIERSSLETFGINTGLGGGTDILNWEKKFFIRNKRLPTHPIRQLPTNL